MDPIVDSRHGALEASERGKFSTKGKPEHHTINRWHHGSMLKKSVHFKHPCTSHLYDMQATSWSRAVPQRLPIAHGAAFHIGEDV